MASDELLATVHDPAFMDAVRLAGRTPTGSTRSTGSAPPDNPTFEGMHEASAHVVGATVEAARAGLDRRGPARREHLRRPAPRDAGPGQRLLRLQRRRGRHPVAARPRRRAGGVRRRRRAPRRRRRGGVLRRPAGAHDQPARDRPDAVPGHRASRATPAVRAPRAARSTSRCRRAPSDAGWLRAFHAVVPPLVREFAPDVLVTQHGCDSHIEDPLAHLMLTVDGQRAAYLALHDLAHEVCDGKWVVTGRRRVRRRRRGAAVLDAPARDRRRRAAGPGHRRPGGVARARAAPARAHRPVPDDRRSHPGVP